MYDLIVIGGGPAGEKAAAAAAYFGKSVVLVDAGAAGPGGATVHTGTLPSKTLRETALYLAGFRSRELQDGLQVEFTSKVPHVRDFMHRLPEIRQRQTQLIAQNLERHGIDYVRGRAEFRSANEVAVDGHTLLHGRYFLVATGSAPRRPSHFDFTDKCVFDSDSILELDDMPATLAVIGGGVIGSEYACVFGALGVKIEVIESGPRLLSFLDHEVSDAIMGAMTRAGIRLHLSDGVESLSREGSRLVLTLKSKKRMEVDKVLVSAGRVGNTRGLGLEKAGVALDDRGLVVVDGTFRTSAPHVYAAGDVIGRPALASTSMEQGRSAVAAMFGHEVPPHDFDTTAAGIYTIPEACSCGPTEEELKARSVPYVAGRAYMKHNARGQIIGDMDGFVKLLFHRESRKLLATHVICERATELIHIGQAVMRLGGGIDFFLETVMTYPSLSVSYKYAAYDALGELSRGKPKPLPLE